jgi:hypothetical protein
MNNAALYDLWEACELTYYPRCIHSAGRDSRLETTVAKLSDRGCEWKPHSELIKLIITRQIQWIS